MEEAINVLVPHTSHHSNRIHTMDEVLRSLRSELGYLSNRIVSLEEDGDINELSL